MRVGGGHSNSSMCWNPVALCEKGLKSRIAPEWIPDRVKSKRVNGEQRRSGKQPLDLNERSFTVAGLSKYLGAMGAKEDVPVLQDLMTDDYSTTASYFRDGQIREKQFFPVRDAAQKAIRRINSEKPQVAK